MFVPHCTLHTFAVIVVVVSKMAAASAANDCIFSMQDFKQAAQAGKGKVSFVW